MPSMGDVSFVGRKQNPWMNPWFHGRDGKQHHTIKMTIIVIHQSTNPRMNESQVGKGTA